MGKVYLHPKLLARRAAEIARDQGGRIERDACGRPFVLPGADPLAGTPVDPSKGLGRLIWALRALGTRPPDPADSPTSRQVLKP